MKLPIPTILGLLTTAIAVLASAGYDDLYERGVDFNDALHRRNLDDSDMIYRRDLYEDFLYKRDLYERAVDRLYARGKTPGGDGGFNADGTVYVNPRPKPGAPVNDDSKFPGRGQRLDGGPVPGSPPRPGWSADPRFPGQGHTPNSPIMPPLHEIPSIPSSPGNSRPNSPVQKSKPKSRRWLEAGY